MLSEATSICVMSDGRDRDNTPAGQTDIGCVRETNEDRFLLEAVPAGKLCIVCDGMGGEEGGEVAAQLAVDTVEAYLKSGKSAKNIAHLLRDSVTRANEEIIAHRQNPGFGAMGASIVTALVSEFEVAIAHVGDTRAYVVRGETIEQLTGDHTYVQELVEQGKISLEESLTHPQSHVLSRCLGPIAGIEASINTFRIEPINHVGPVADALVLMSDGLYRFVSDAEVARVIAKMSPEQSCRELIERAKARGGLDNIAILVYPLNGKLVRVSENDLSQMRMYVEESESAVSPVSKAPQPERKPIAPQVISFDSGLQKQPILQSVKSKRSNMMRIAIAVVGILAIAVIAAFQLSFRQAETALTVAVAPRDAQPQPTEKTSAIEASKAPTAATSTSETSAPKEEAAPIADPVSSIADPKAKTEPDVKEIKAPNQATPQPETTPVGDSAQAVVASTTDAVTTTDSAPASTAQVEPAVSVPAISEPVVSEPVVTEPAQTTTAQAPAATGSTPTGSGPVTLSYQETISEQARVFFEQGVQSVEAGNFSDAIVNFKTSLTLNPNNADAHYNLGTIYAKDKKYDVAIRSFQSALRVDPKHGAARYNLAYVYYMNQMSDEALSTFREFIEVAQGDPELRKRIPDVQRMIRRLEEVISRR